MNIDDYTKPKNRNKSKDKNIIKYLRHLITRVLLSIILVISICISLKIDTNNKRIVKQYLFEDNLSFTKINKWYQDKFGKIIPTINTSDELVFSNTEISTSKYEKYLDGVKIVSQKNSPIASIYGGIVVFIGEREGYGSSVIIQGNDGIDYQYSNITNINLNLYDYIEKDTLIGELKDDYFYLVLEKEGKYLDYEEYISQIKD